MIELKRVEGNPPERGGLLGKESGQILQQALNSFRPREGEDWLVEGPVTDQARSLTSLINAAVPEWVTEARAMAQAAKVPTAALMAANAAPWPEHLKLSTPEAEGSTSCIFLDSECQAEETILLVNLDHIPVPVYAFNRAPSPGTLGYLGLSAGARLGVLAFLNESGLAGFWQMGPMLKDGNNGFPPGLVLRAIAEKSPTCRHALELFSQYQERFGIYTPGGRGLTFSFADPVGEMLVIESARTRHAAAFYLEGMAISTNSFQLKEAPGGRKIEVVLRQRRMQEFFDEGEVDPSRVLTASRMETPGQLDVCNQATSASFMAVIRRAEGGGNYALVSLGPPSHVLPLLLFPETGVPRPAMDGSVWAAAQALRLERKGQAVPPTFFEAFDAQLRDLLIRFPEEPAPDGLRREATLASYDWLIDFFDRAREETLGEAGPE